MSVRLLESGADFSPCGRYRYALHRVWTAELPRVVFIGLNPSTADACRDDPTIRRCIRFAESWGYGGVTVVNLFAFRATDPADLFRAEHPVGPENDAAISHSQEKAALVIAAWGNHGVYRNRAGSVLKLLKNPHALRVNRTGQPAHPLYLPGNLSPCELRF